ncbi:MAG: PAS domain-containing protein, partial [Deltaproteobacteria bacterium]|nr:PAS domain-containing protein [Deltaproteobacteria bacterium]
MTGASIIVTGLTSYFLYHAALNEGRERLVETATSQARLIEAVARFDAKYSQDYPEGTIEATLSQIREAHARHKHFGRTSEFTLAKRVGDDVVFLLRHYPSGLDERKPVPFSSELAEPMRRALSGQSGTVIGLDYRGEKVLAAYEPVAELNMGIVAKIDFSEIREPFIRAGAYAGLVMLIVVLIGSLLFLRVTNPFIMRLEETVRKRTNELKSANEELQKEIIERKQAEEALRVAEKEKTLILDSTLDSVVYFDTDMKVLWVNQIAASLIDKSPDDLVGGHCFELWYQRSEPCPGCPVVLARDTGQPHKGEITNLDGRVWLIRSYPVLNDEGEVDGVVEFALDITERRKAEEELKEERERAQLYLRVAGVMFIALDRDG